MSDATNFDEPSSRTVVPPNTVDQPGATDASRIPAGGYAVDPDHTFVTWAVNHMGFSVLEGQVTSPTGSITIDPAALADASVEVAFGMDHLSVGVPAFAHHLKSAELFDAATHPTARFVSREVRDVQGPNARILGNLTLKGVTRPIVLSATFVGAGTNPMSGRLNFGFSATATIRRSDFGLGFIVPVVSDEVRLRIAAAFLVPDPAA